MIKTKRFATNWAAMMVASTMTLGSVHPVYASYASPPPRPVENPSDEDISHAKVLYDNGRSLYDEGSYQGAAMAFEQSYRLSGDINVLYNVSLSYDRAGDFENALRFLEYYRALAPESERANLTDKVESLKLRLEKQREQEADAVAALESAADQPEPPPPPATNKTATPSNELASDNDASSSDEPKIFTPAAAILTAAAGVSLGVGIGFGISSLRQTRAAQAKCAGQFCDIQVSDELARAKTYALITDLSIGIGAAATVALATILIYNRVKRDRAQPDSSSARIQPHWGGLRVRF